VFNEDQKTIQRMAPLLQRALIVDPQPAGARLLADLMRNIAGSQTWVAPSAQKALALAKSIEPHLIFVETSGAGAGAVEFTRTLRRSDLTTRQAPVIMVTANATAAGVMAARDAGVHEFLRKPFTTKDLLRRLEAITLRPRDWIEAVSYVGPDRRRFNSGDYSGALKRRSDAQATPDSERILQALKILKAAVAAVDSDPAQALRSMQAQAQDLQRAAVTSANMKLSTLAADFQRWLIQASGAGPLDVAELADHAAPLLAMIPQEPERDVAAA